MEEDIQEGDDEGQYSEEEFEPEKASPKPKEPEKAEEVPKPVEAPKPVYGSKPSFGVNKLGSKPKIGMGGNPVSKPVEETKPAEEDPKERLNRIMRERQQQLEGAGQNAAAPPKKDYPWSGAAVQNSGEKSNRWGAPEV